MLHTNILTFGADPLPKRLTIAIILLLFAVNLLYFYWSMAHTFIIPGIDGPYYYIQVNSLLHSGTLIYPDPPFVFYAFALFATALGNTVTGVMVGSAVFAAATSIAIYLLFLYMFKSQVPAVAAALISIFSAEHVKLASDLMKNSVGILFVVGVIFFLQRCLDSDKRWKWNILGAIGLFVMTLLTHVLDEGVALLFIFLYLGFSLMFTERKKLLLKYGSIFLVCSALAISAFIALPAFFGDFQKGINFVSEVSSSSSETATLPNPAGAGPIGMQNPLVYFFLALGVVLSFYEMLRGDRKKAVLLASSTVIGILLILPFIPSEFVSRFQFMEFLPAAIIVGYALTKIKRKDLLALATVALVLPVIVVGFQSANASTPSISPQAYADLQRMATLISSNNSVMVVESMGPAPYWPQYVLGLPAVSNASTWLHDGYNVYVLVGRMQTPNNQPNFQDYGFPPFQAGPNGRPQAPFLQPTQPRLPGGNAAQQNPQGANADLSNATLLYNGNTYDLYQIKTDT
jgi:4-amino-4-deoxy-L-arabinose transferase-like glycosyltransferase